MNKTTTTEKKKRCSTEDKTFLWLGVVIVICVFGLSMIVSNHKEYVWKLTTDDENVCRADVWTVSDFRWKREWDSVRMYHRHLSTEFSEHCSSQRVFTVDHSNHIIRRIERVVIDLNDMERDRYGSLHFTVVHRCDNKEFPYALALRYKTGGSFVAALTQEQMDNIGFYVDAEFKSDAWKLPEYNFYVPASPTDTC
jgi:hypothetical protein